MTKFYSFLAAIALTATINAQTTSSITINAANIGGTAALGTGNYSSGAERTWTTSSISFGGKAITGNATNTPTSGLAAGSVIQTQANNGVIYNTTALPGKIVSVTINSVGTERESSLFGGSARLVNTTAADYAVTGGTQVGAASTTGWTSTDLAGTDYRFFAVKRGASAAYITSIVVVYENPTMAVVDATNAKANLVKNTVVSNELIFGAAAKVSIYSTAGQIWKTAEVMENSKMDISTLPKGIYIVTANINGEAFSQKIIKK